MRDQLTVAGIKRLKPKSYDALHADGGNLYLKVTTKGTKSWVFRWKDRVTGKLRDMGLGPFPDVGLAEARDLATEQRRVVRDGGDPIAERRRARDEHRAQRLGVPTFDQCATSYIERHSPGWRNAKHKAQWENTLATYASPIIGSLLVSEVTQNHVLAVLEPIWPTKTETATRVRQRIEAVLDYATAHEWRRGENPARWRGRLDKLLPKARKKSTPMKSLPRDEVGSLIQALHELNTEAARALEFTILTGARTGEVRWATWNEIDLKKKTWVLSPERMKAERSHRVPLSKASVRLLKKQQGRHATLVFSYREKRLSDGAMRQVLRRLGLKSRADVHGFRSTFADWATVAGYDKDLADLALAHPEKDKTRAAYFRDDRFEERVVLMEDWARFCSKRPKKIKETA